MGDTQDTQGSTHPAEDDFDPIWYLQTYPDVRDAGLDPWEHYTRLGRAEGRQIGAVRALDLDHQLWRGFEDTALPALQDLLQNGSKRERAVAGWALARWQVEQGDWAAARAAILVFHTYDEGAQIIPHAGPFLLAVQACLLCSDFEGAQQSLAQGIEKIGETADFNLAQMYCAIIQNDTDRNISKPLAAPYLAHGLRALHIKAGDGSRFDRLQADPAQDPPAPLPENPPLVSIIIPVFNGESGLDLALRGLVAQSWPNLEILVVDDGSTDASAQIAQDWAQKDPRIRCLPLGKNQGAYPARNVGFAAATGAYITVHDADDWSHPEKIQAQVSALIDAPTVQACVSHWVRASNDLDMTRWRMEEAWIYRNVSSLMIRASLRDSLGYWDRVRVNADTEYYYRILATFGADSIIEVHPGVPLAFGRTEASSLTMQSATHLRTQFGGVRRDYIDAARQWHDQAAHAPDNDAQKGGKSALYLPQHPKFRPFHVPALIGVNDPEGPPTAFDILSKSEMFDPRWYRMNHPDVMRADMNPVSHYLVAGAQENRDPGPRFSTGGYRRAQGLGSDINPLLHYETKGRADQAATLPCFQGALAQTPVDSPENTPRTLVFAHISGQSLFGAERSLLAVVGRMADRGQCPVVVLPEVCNTAYLERLLAVTVAVEVVPQLWRQARQSVPQETLDAIGALIKKHRPQEIHVNTLVLDAPLIAARDHGIPNVVHVRELPAQDVDLCRFLGQDAGPLLQVLKQQTDRFIANSAPVAAWLACPERTEIRPNSIDEALFDLPFSPGQNFKVALISSNVAKKGLADFLAVARIVETANRPIRFLFIGPATADLHMLRPWPSNVDFCDYAPDPIAALKQADLVVSLSKFAESFGRTVMEAMAAGRPVICYDRGAPPSLIRSGETGFCVPVDSPQSVANAVLALEISRLQLQKMSDAARKRARVLQEQALRF